MTKQELQTKLASVRNGTYINITFMSDIMVDKEHKGHVVQKMVSAVTRLGVAYSHIEADTIKYRPVDNVTPEKLPWGEWDPECKYLIKHKDNYYLRCTVSRAPNHHRQVRYFVDGVEVEKEIAMLYTRPSEWNKQNDEFVYNPKLANVLSLGKEG